MSLDEHTLDLGEPQVNADAQSSEAPPSATSNALPAPTHVNVTTHPLHHIVPTQPTPVPSVEARIDQMSQVLNFVVGLVMPPHAPPSMSNASMALPMPIPPIPPASQSAEASVAGPSNAIPSVPAGFSQWPIPVGQPGPLTGGIAPLVAPPLPVASRRRQCAKCRDAGRDGYSCPGKTRREYCRFE